MDIEEAEKRFNEILTSLNWTIDDLQTPRNQNKSPVVKVDHIYQEEIHPDVVILPSETPSESDRPLTLPERLEQYQKDCDYALAVRQMKPSHSIPVVDLDSIQNGNPESTVPCSKIDLLNLQRDYKRRRQKYRAKNVHVTKRTPQQIIRDLYNEQMDALFALSEYNSKRSSNDPSQKSDQRDPPPVHSIEESHLGKRSREENTKYSESDHYPSPSRTHNESRESRYFSDRHSYSNHPDSDSKRDPFPPPKIQKHSERSDRDRSPDNHRRQNNYHESRSFRSRRDHHRSRDHR